MRFAEPFLVLCGHPPVDGLASVIKRSEQVWIEQFFPEGLLEALDVGVPIGLARVDLLDRYASLPSRMCERLSQLSLVSS